MTEIEVPELIIKNISQLITMSSAGLDNSQPRTGTELLELGIIENGAIAVIDDKIVGIDDSKRMLASFDISKDTVVISANNKTVLPGFIDPHTHLIFSGTRETELALKLEGKTYMEILHSGGGILKTVRETRAASLENLVQQANKRLNIMLAHGTTTIEAKSGYGLDLDAELKSLEAIKKLNETHPIDIVPTFLGAHAVPPEFKNDPDGYIDTVIQEMLPAVISKRLAIFCDVFCEEGVFDITQSERLLKVARQLGYKLKLHVDEFVPIGGAELAAKLGAVSADHLAMSTDTGLKALGVSGVVGTLLPGTPFAIMEKHYPAARKMVKLGVPIALATDLNPNCFTESMQFIISLACYNMKMLPAEAITAATINAAHAIGAAKDIGSLEIGKKADIVIFDVPNYHHIPYHFGINQVEKVIKNGKLVVDRASR